MLFGTKCPCNSGQAYRKCCEPFLEGRAKPETAEQLVRSRFTAFKYQKLDYIYQTMLPKVRKKIPRATLEQMMTQVEWSKMEVKKVEGGGIEDEIGKVEFVAEMKAQGKTLPHHEVSFCQKVEGQWFYADAKVISQVQTAHKEKTIGRNDPCPCGSGKKYKKCCGK